MNALLTYMGSQALGFDVPLIYFIALIPLSRFVTLLPISLGHRRYGRHLCVHIVTRRHAGGGCAGAGRIYALSRLGDAGALGLVFLYDSVRFKREESAATR